MLRPLLIVAVVAVALWLLIRAGIRQPDPDCWHQGDSLGIDCVPPPTP